MPRVEVGDYLWQRLIEPWRIKPDNDRSDQTTYPTWERSGPDPTVGARPHRADPTNPSAPRLRTPRAGADGLVGVRPPRLSSWVGGCRPVGAPSCWVGGASTTIRRRTLWTVEGPGYEDAPGLGLTGIHQLRTRSGTRTGRKRLTA